MLDSCRHLFSSNRCDSFFGFEITQMSRLENAPPPPLTGAGLPCRSHSHVPSDWPRGRCPELTRLVWAQRGGHKLGQPERPPPWRSSRDRTPAAVPSGGGAGRRPARGQPLGTHPWVGGCGKLLGCRQKPSHACLIRTQLT